MQEDKLVLREVKFWNMPYVDLIEVEKVWQKAKEVVESGSIVASTHVNKSKKLIRKTNFPSTKFSDIAHVSVNQRPKISSFQYPEVM